MKVMVPILIVFLSWSTRGGVHSAPRHPRLTLAEPAPNYYYRNINGNPDTYSFGYDVWDPITGNLQFRQEERYPNGTVVGSYGYIDPQGKSRRYNYIADEKGYRITSDPYNQRNEIPAVINPDNLNSESSVTWSRPSKKKLPQMSQNTFMSKPIERRKYNSYQPPSYYALY